ncbi:hypothetical protein [Thiolapillus sp.]|uniref:hypothetical protein n=1 Tax=Thiolapillus sp. TaxID=2017437 RepID=UPI00260139BB|nr:hypothetical protein [Thiolapillus sp.]
MIDFGTSQSPKSTRPLTTYWCPSRPGHQALRNNFASSLLLRTWLPMTGRRVRRPTLLTNTEGTPGKQCGLAATGVYQPSLRSPWLAAGESLHRVRWGKQVWILGRLHQIDGDLLAVNGAVFLPRLAGC